MGRRAPLFLPLFFRLQFLLCRSLDGLVGDDDDLRIGTAGAGECVAVTGGHGGGAGGAGPVAQLGDAGITLMRDTGVVQVDVDNAVGFHAGQGAFLDEQRALTFNRTAVVGDAVFHGGARQSDVLGAGGCGGGRGGSA